MRETEKAEQSGADRQLFDTLVIGGGYAGLAAMQVLTEGKVNALLCEARNEQGGRTIPSRKENTALPERGAFFVYTNAMKQRLEKTGIEVTEFPNDAYYIVNQKKEIVPAGADGGPVGLAKLVTKEILTCKKNISYSDFFKTSRVFNTLSENDQKAVRALFEADLAGPLDEVGISSAFYDGQTVGADNDFFGICTKGGLSTLASSMAEGLPQESRKTGARVQRIRVDNDGFAFELVNASKDPDTQREELHAKNGILTAPLGAMNTITFVNKDGSQKPLREAMRLEVQHALDMIGSGSVVKIGLKIKKPLINGKKMVHIAIPPPDEGPIRCASIRALPLATHNAHEQVDEGQMLLMYLGGRQASDFMEFCNSLSVAKDESKLEKIKAIAVEYLHEHAGIDPALITDDSIDISGWSPEKGDRTAYSYIKADGESSDYNPRSAFRESVLPANMPALYLAGEAYSETGATLTTGAFDSGVSAAQKIKQSAVESHR